MTWNMKVVQEHAELVRKHAAILLTPMCQLLSANVLSLASTDDTNSSHVAQEL